MRDRNVYLILGGAGLVGFQVCRTIAKKLEPQQIIVASLHEQEARSSKGTLQSEFPDVDWQTAHGNLFVPLDLSEKRRTQIAGSKEYRKQILDHIFGDFEVAYEKNALARMIVERRPDVIVDCVNTATAISYQDVFGSTAQVQERLASIEESPEDLAGLREDIEVLMMSQGPPQLIRHLRLLFRASQEAEVGVYVKVGTTGTGGMGLNIPYTHSEDRPSSKLLHKTEVAFGHTGLLFLMARTPGAPIVKEVKPAAMVGYRAVQYEAVVRDGAVQHLYEPKRLEIADLNALNLRESPEGYEDLGELQTTVVNTGENGVFTRGEFGAITAIGQMEFVTPEEIARTVALEIRGATTGRDVISALDSTVIDPSYRAGMIRTVAMQDLAAVEENMDDHSVALGQLGPPELSKLLFEAHLIKETFGPSYDALLFDGGDINYPMTPAEASQRITERCLRHPVCQRATSVGIPILAGDGKTLMRGPRINVPEVQSRSKVVQMHSEKQLNAYAKKGWVDLRPANMKLWQERFHRMVTARALVATEGSAAFTLETHFSQEIEIGELVAWIFNNELDGSRLN